MGWGLLPYGGYVAMCDRKEYGVSAVLVINRVGKIADAALHNPIFDAVTLELSHGKAT